MRSGAGILADDEEAIPGDGEVRAVVAEDLAGEGEVERQHAVDDDRCDRLLPVPDLDAHPPRPNTRDDAADATHAQPKAQGGPGEMVEMRGTRTPDLRVANAALSQLSYIPTGAAPDGSGGRRER